MKHNEEQFVMVPVSLSPEQATLVGPMVAHDWGIIIQHAGTPIPPCADVDTVGYGREASFSDLKGDGCHGVSIHKEWDGGIPLVRRTDMEAQVARAKASCHLNAEAIATRIMQDVQELPDRTSPEDQPDRLLVTVDELEGIIRAALNEGSAK